MLTLKEIEKFYPDNEKLFKRNIRREYLQYKILEIIFKDNISNKMCFIGGTCIRMVYGTSRFSEDLDFDNFGLTINEFTTLSNQIKKELELIGYNVETKIVSKQAFRCYIKIPKLLLEEGLTNFSNEKITIQLDTESQGYNYEPEKFLLNKFDVFTHILTAPSNILLSQKLWAIINRKVLKGRDLYDVTFLYSFTKPDFNYLKLKANIDNIKKLKEALFNRIKNENLSKLAKDVEPFLINSSEIKRILNFRDFIDSIR